MAVQRSYARLGLFLVFTLAVILATALLFIQKMRSRAVIEMVTYTEDNVGGLDVSSAVRYRGVAIGRVSEVRIEIRGSLIEIDFEVFLDRLNTTGAGAVRVQEMAESGVLAKMRSQVVANPVTGEAYLLLDVPANPPPAMALAFTPKRTYVPSRPTALAVIQDRLPAVLERAEATLQVLRDIVARIPDSLDRSDRFFTSVERIFQDSNLPALSSDTRKFFATTTSQVESMVASLDGLAGKNGTLVAFADETSAAIKAADFPATSQATRSAMDQASLAAEDLRRALPSIRESLDQLRELARQLQDQPESVVFGPRPAGGKKK